MDDVGPRKPRADAERNRIALIQAAKAGFTELGAEVSLEEIARRAGVGIGTLYRHFPTRDAVVQAVYQREVAQLADAALPLLEGLGAMEGLRSWMRLFVEYALTKRIISPALNALAGKSELFAATGERMTAAVGLLLARGKDEGRIRPEIEPMDLLYAMTGLLNVPMDAAWEARASRLIDVLIAGIRQDDA